MGCLNLYKTSVDSESNGKVFWKIVKHFDPSLHFPAYGRPSFAVDPLIKFIVDCRLLFDLNHYKEIIKAQHKKKTNVKTSLINMSWIWIHIQSISLKLMSTQNKKFNRKNELSSKSPLLCFIKKKCHFMQYIFFIENLKKLLKRFIIFLFTCESNLLIALKPSAHRYEQFGLSFQLFRYLFNGLLGLTVF